MDRPDVAWTSCLDALADKCQFIIRVQSSNIHYYYPSLDKKRRLKVLPGRNGPLKGDGGTSQSPLASDLRGPSLPSYSGMSIWHPQAEVELTGSRALNVCLCSLRSEYNSAGGPGAAGEDRHATLPQLLRTQHTVYLAHDGKTQLPQEHPPHP